MSVVYFGQLLTLTVWCVMSFPLMGKVHKQGPVDQRTGVQVIKED